MWKNDFAKLFIGQDQVGLGVHTSEPRTSQQAMQAAHLLRTATRHLLPGLDYETNARGTYFWHLNAQNAKNAIRINT